MRRLRSVAAAFALAAALALPPSANAADSYPSRPVKIIVPFGAGGPTDLFTRAVAEELSKALHQPFVLENRPGAGTTIGTEVVAKAPPNGYTLLMVSGTQAVNEQVNQAGDDALARKAALVALEQKEVNIEWRQDRVRCVVNINRRALATGDGAAEDAHHGQSLPFVGRAPVAQIPPAAT